MTDQIATRLTKRDQLWVLGDISSGNDRDEVRALEILSELRKQTRAQFHLIAGNHDNVSSIHRNAWQKQALFREAFDSIQNFAEITIDGERVLLSHFPYENLGDGPNREGSRYNQFRLKDEGRLLVHGHTHQETPHASEETTNQFCVSWDVKRNLVTEHELITWVRSERDKNNG